MKAISCLGFTEYQPTKYQFRGKIVETAFFPFAIPQFFEISELLVLVTEKVKTVAPNKTLIKKNENADELNLFVSLSKSGEKTNFELLCDIFEATETSAPNCFITSEGLKIRAVNIPDGKTPEELWKIFEIMTDSLAEKDRVVFDITYGFRSLPLLSFLAVSYLRLIKSIELEAIVYGAFDAKVEGVAPVFDLSPFLSLLDWTNATDQFIKTGNAKSLAGMLKNFGGMPKNLADCFGEISLGLSTLRPLDVMEQASKLGERISDATDLIKKEVPPFVPLMEKIRDNYQDFELSDAKQDNRDMAVKRLAKQLRMVVWYQMNQRWVHALSMARETLVSLLCFHFGLDSLNKTFRKKMEDLLNKFYDSEVVEYQTEWQTFDENLRNEIHKLWGGRSNNFLKATTNEPDLTSLRNDVLHAGQLRNAKSTQTVVEQSEKVIKDFVEIVGKWRI